jgi:hypothetical protein
MPDADADDERSPPEPREAASESEPEADARPAPAKFVMLDPDINRLAFASRPFAKMSAARIRVPTSFADLGRRAKAKAVTKRPFHPDIFMEIFEKIKTFRKSRLMEADRDILATIPRESGRDHVLENMSVYVEPPPMPDDETEEERREPPQRIWQPRVAADAKGAYSQLCQQFVQLMIKLGEEKVVRPVGSQILAAWERRLMPRLDRELQRKPFDIQEMREWVKNVLRANKGEMTFRSMTSTLRSHEVSRAFLSTLILANSQEVVLMPIEEGVREGEFIVRLVSGGEPSLSDSDD